MCSVVDAHVPEAYNRICLPTLCCSVCVMSYVLSSHEKFVVTCGNLWFHSPFVLTATVGWVDFGSCFYCKWIILTLCHCTFKSFRRSEVKRTWVTPLGLCLLPCAAFVSQYQNVLNVCNWVNLIQRRTVVRMIGHWNCRLFSSILEAFMLTGGRRSHSPSSSLLFTKVKSVYSSVNFNISYFLSDPLENVILAHF